MLMVMFKRDGHFEGRTLVFFAVYFYASTHFMNNIPYVVQSEAKAFYIVQIAGGHTVKLVKYTFCLFLAHAYTLV